MSTPDALSIAAALARNKNVLLEGPPGTGKTRLVTDLISALATTTPSPGGGRPQIIPDAGFTTAAGKAASSPLPSSMEIAWVTFHQGYTYDEFVLGWRPVPQGSGGLRLEPHFGVLMTLALNLGPFSQTNGVLLVIDEVNRANASQVFGEFITLLDPEYRDTVNGNPNSRKVHPSLPGLSYSEGLSEPVKMLRGGTTHQLLETWAFPESFYVLATMNSVDKAALPLDSALTRRFHRIALGPDLPSLASALGLSWADIETAANVARTAGGWSALTAEATTVLLLERLNLEISSDLSSDFELGHGLVWPVADAPPAARWEELIRCWDHAILPQLVERFAGRDETLREVLKVDSGTTAGSVFSTRALLGQAPSGEGPLSLPPLASVSLASARDTLQWLAV